MAKLSKTETKIIEKMKARGQFACDDSDGVRIQNAAKALVEKGIAKIVRLKSYSYHLPRGSGNYHYYESHIGQLLVIEQAVKGES